MTTIPLTVTEIALLSELQIQSLDVLALNHCLKLLGIKGYSKKNKTEKALTVFQASDVLRQALTQDKKEKELLAGEIKTKKEKDQNEIIKNQADNTLSESNILDLLKRNDAFTVGKTIFTIFEKTGDKSMISICTNQGKKLKAILEMMLGKTLIDIQTKDGIMKGFNYMAVPYRLPERMKERAKVDSYVLQGEKEFSNPSLIIDWAKNNLFHKSYIYKSLALAILSGRRMIEIFYCGDYSLADNGMIHIEGLAKKKATDTNFCNFIPLCDAELWLESWHSLEKAVTEKRVNSYFSIMISRGFPVELKDLNIEKFKESRDFYAGVCVGIFKELGYNIPEHFTMKLMGHSTGESTKQYRKYNMFNLPSDLVEKFKFYKG